MSLNDQVSDIRSAETAFYLHVERRPHLREKNVYLKIINFIYMYALILQHMWKSKWRKKCWHHAQIDGNRKIFFSVILRKKRLYKLIESKHLVDCQLVPLTSVGL